MEKSDARPSIAGLAGKVLWRCTRAANVVMFDFGERGRSSAESGAPRDAKDMALHVQCAWRVTRRESVIVASRDIHYPADYSECDEIPPEFDWDRKRTRLDRLIDEFFQAGSMAYLVHKVEAGRAGYLRVSLADGFILELFPDDSLASEHWRLFAPGEHRPHLVVEGKNL
jgi:hypothetical protein